MGGKNSGRRAAPIIPDLEPLTRGGELLQNYVVDRGWTLAQAKRELGLSEWAYRRLVRERGADSVTVEEALDFLSMCGIPIEAWAEYVRRV